MNTLKVIKIGGHLLDDEELLGKFMQDFTTLEGYKILVHGGGKKATDVSKSLGLEVKMIKGRRVTTKADLDVTIMVYAGLINKTLVAELQALNVDALGLSGADLNLIKAIKRPSVPIDFGHVGDIDENGVNGDKLSSLLESDFVPIFSAITHDAQGNLFNTNADTIATNIAKAMAASYHVELIFCFEKEGVLNSANELIDTLNDADFDELKKQNAIKDGMIPKLTNGFDALSGGVNVWIKHAKNLTQPKGTELI